ncbi:MAG: energy transducer TonB [Thermonemataceae bacterium]
MTCKKNPQLDTFRKTHLFFLVGLILSLSLVITAFEWRTLLVTPIVIESVEDNTIFEEVTPVQYRTEQPEVQAPAPRQETDRWIVKEDYEPPREKERKETQQPTADEPSPHPLTEINATKPSHKPIEMVKEPVVLVPDVQAKPEGGYEAFYQYIRKNVEYPNEDKRIGRSGTVYLTFVVETDGTLTDIEIVRGVSNSIDAAALETLKKCPIKWQPGVYRHQPVRVRMTIPIRFALQR